MKTLGNIIWLIFTGFVSAVSWFLLGVVWCITIIGIPFGKQCFKLASLSHPVRRDCLVNTRSVRFGVTKQNPAGLNGVAIGILSLRR